MTSRNDIETEARRMAKEGLGYEDIFVRLRHLGVTKSYAREVVFRRHFASRQGSRSIMTEMTPAEAGRRAAKQAPIGEKLAAYNKAYHKARYKTEEYRKYSRDYCRRRYREDPEFRERRNAAVMRHKAKKSP